MRYFSALWARMYRFSANSRATISSTAIFLSQHRGNNAPRHGARRLPWRHRGRSGLLLATDLRDILAIVLFSYDRPHWRRLPGLALALASPLVRPRARSAAAPPSAARPRPAAARRAALSRSVAARRCRPGDGCREGHAPGGGSPATRPSIGRINPLPPGSAKAGSVSDCAGGGCGSGVGRNSGQGCQPCAATPASPSTARPSRCCRRRTTARRCASTRFRTPPGAAALRLVDVGQAWPTRITPGKRRGRRGGARQRRRRRGCGTRAVRARGAAGVVSTDPGRLHAPRRDARRAPVGQHPVRRAPRASRSRRRRAPRRSCARAGAGPGARARRHRHPFPRGRPARWSPRFPARRARTSAWSSPRTCRNPAPTTTPAAAARCSPPRWPSTPRIRRGAIPPPARTHHVPVAQRDQRQPAVAPGSSGAREGRGRDVLARHDRRGHREDRRHLSDREDARSRRRCGQRPSDPHTEWGGGNVDARLVRGSLLNDLHLAVALRRARDTGWVVRTNPYEGGSDHTVFTTRRRAVAAQLALHRSLLPHQPRHARQGQRRRRCSMWAITVAHDGAVPRVGARRTTRPALRGLWRGASGARLATEARTTPARDPRRVAQVVRRGARERDEIASRRRETGRWRRRRAGAYISVTYCLTMRRVEKRGSSSASLRARPAPSGAAAAAARRARKTPAPPVLRAAVERVGVRGVGGGVIVGLVWLSISQPLRPLKPRPTSRRRCSGAARR